MKSGICKAANYSLGTDATKRATEKPAPAASPVILEAQAVYMFHRPAEIAPIFI
jgi:hypothetical protein